MCFFMLLVCVVGISNGPVGSVYFFEQDVQNRVVELGLTTKEKIKRDYAIAGIALFVPVLFFSLPWCILSMAQETLRISFGR